MRSKGDLYRRRTSFINRSKENLVVNEYMKNNYHLLVEMVVSEDDWDVFQDTYLAMTASYDSRLDFVEEFKRNFTNIRIEYQKKGKQMKSLVCSLDECKVLL